MRNFITMWAAWLKVSLESSQSHKKKKKKKVDIEMEKN